MKQNSQNFSLTKSCKNMFESHVRARGESYFQNGFVTKLFQNDHSAQFHVLGEKNYKVVIDWRRSDTNISCTCPYFKSGMYCKHAWASILYIDKNGKTSKDSMLADKESIELSSETHPLDKPKFDPTPSWLMKIDSINKLSKIAISHENHFLPKKCPEKVYYSLNLETMHRTGDLLVEFLAQETMGSNESARYKNIGISFSEISEILDPLDQEIIIALIGNEFSNYDYYERRYSKAKNIFHSAIIPNKTASRILEKLSESGRFFFQSERDGIPASHMLSFNPKEKWSTTLTVVKSNNNFEVSGCLDYSDKKIPIENPILVTNNGFLLFENRIAQMKEKEDLSWYALLRNEKKLLIPHEDGDRFVEKMLMNEKCPVVNWPEELRWEKIHIAPKPKILFSYSKQAYFRTLRGDVRFLYGEIEVSLDQEGPILNREKRIEIIRDRKAEKEFFTALSPYKNMIQSRYGRNQDIYITVEEQHFPEFVKKLIASGCEVEAHGKKLSLSKNIEIAVSSGIDWFDLDAKVEFETGQFFDLPKLLLALEKRERLIPLGDGTYGVLPEEWLRKYVPLMDFGEKQKDGKIRFSRATAPLLNSWISDEHDVTFDEKFSKLSTLLRKRRKLTHQKPSKNFVGELRTYQKEGLTWLNFIQETGIGGILADDMGLGKTVQVLAYLESQHSKKLVKPSIVIMPKSLFYNWQEEAARFTPNLKVFSYSTGNKRELENAISSYDIILVTYSRLRQDIEEFKKYEYSVAIVDEAQTIKNRESLVHRACLELRAEHKLAMTGTPVENSIDDLFSILKFTSPGLISAKTRERFSRAANTQESNTDDLSQLSKALTPFVLRRTKGEVLTELPEKTELILHCELSKKEQNLYNDLRDYYRLNLKNEISSRGLAKSKIVILEAILRLRQAACHPGLLDKKQISSDSAKIETLLAQIEEISKEGHKALVFSQFTSFLDIVENILTKKKIKFVRLDGSTSMEKRREKVEEFQTKKDLGIFLISLKAGGVGLNLTAADYVFLLDPWWNPSAETQAIDRAHRIGQKNKVIAYRLIAKGTIEEKIIELQKTKKDLAQALISENTNFMRKITIDDLNVLLS